MDESSHMNTKIVYPNHVRFTAIQAHVNSPLVPREEIDFLLFFCLGGIPSIKSATKGLHKIGFLKRLFEKFSNQLEVPRF